MWRRYLNYFPWQGTVNRHGQEIIAVCSAEKGPLKEYQNTQFKWTRHKLTMITGTATSRQTYNDNLTGPEPTTKTNSGRHGD
mmetsp:Transcript_10992/g.23307  ORF Transcript_10992/g.23307 Transcript_10992/m.23307 type:complete len:82 (-) Transcript_10992:1-246(-)